jgi:hypothetical protein
MKDFQNDIDKLVSKILSEEIDSKVRKMMDTKSEFDEELTGGQSKIDVAEPKGKITAADFKKLRDAKTHKGQVEEYFMELDLEDDEDDNYGEYSGDEEEEEEAEEMSQNEPTYVGRGLKDNKIISKVKNAIRNRFNNDEDEEELDIETDWSQLEENEVEENIFKKMFGKKEDPEMTRAAAQEKDRKENPSLSNLGYDYDDIRGWHMPEPGQGRFDNRDSEDVEMEEGNAFSGARAQAIEDGEDTFEVDGKTYHVKGEKRMDESDDKFIQKSNMKKGALHKALGIPEGNKIPKSKLNSIKKDLMSKAKGDKKLSDADSKLLKQVNMALTLGGLKESKHSVSLTENELIDMIEMIVLQEQEKVKDSAEKNTFSVNKPQGLKKTEKAQGESKKENDDYTQEVVKKMKDYMKDMYMGGKGYDANPDDFPQSNYDMEKEHNEMKYHPSDAVEEYIEAFSYPGMTNLVYDEIKPDDDMIDKQIKGDSKNGNAITGKDGKALGNVSKRSEKVGDRFKKNFDENLYGAEQMNVSYKRQSQPVDIAGSKKQNGSLKSIKSSSTGKAEKIMNQLESVESKATKIINEDLQKMKNLISYNRKTQ